MFGKFNQKLKTTHWNNLMKQYLFHFENGYGASVISNGIAYGNSKKPYELAVIEKNGDEWCLCFDTEITDDVIAYLDENDVVKILEKIEKLEKKTL